MKRERNMQLVKVNEKNPPTQTKEEEIGRFPGKQFRIMRVKVTKILKT